MPGKKGFEHMHVRVREPHPGPTRALGEAIQAVILEMGVDELACFFGKPLRRAILGNVGTVLRRELRRNKS
jgi:hypothetical protein